MLLLLVVPGYLVFCAGAKLFAAGGSFLPWQSHPAESKDALVATAEANAQPAKTPACQKLLAELSRLGKFECSLQSDLGTGRVRFVFPDEKIGSLIDNVNAHDARGTVWVRKGEPLNFIVDDYLEPTAFVCPELFEHFGPDDLTSLHIKCNPGSKGAYDSLSPSDEADLVLTRVLRTISTWRRLKSLNLDGFRETKKNLEQVGDLPALERLALARSSCRMSD